ncbi:MAG: polymerase, sigma-24 subunit, subfamily [Bacteroidetes bacterium]|jgi:RNA polymerase sigma factor (sigma-70 family)|uniref:RNA polymerase sigma factor n=1 Tax=unclassified Chitinophaga TaxID=2619133 RepID=UPI0009D49E67|nr:MULTISPECIES: sigma-70 family RNA polymerase sigma factor [unclassified Chitinophaga]MBP1653069.1 polymerase, sigma-24 subunit, subfamily [Bacteroidota bacterium]OMP80813.1 RNA polymerase [[Flexibacter] sp. ATCC 35208]WPV70049.1 sigma-70 family RNA polymerase sigma factor [Chitinophaga sp. LS1]
MQSESHVLWWNAFKQGDWDAFTALYGEFYELLNNYGRKFTRDEDLIHDVVHDLFVRIWTTRQRLGQPVSVKNYLYKAFRSTLFRKIQSLSKFVELDGEGTGFTVNFIPDASFRQEEQELRKQVIDLVNTLPARQQEIIFLRFYEGMSYEEISTIMDINMSSTYKLLYKALDNLQKASNKQTWLLLCGLFFLLKNISKKNPVLEG